MSRFSSTIRARFGLLVVLALWTQATSGAEDPLDAVDRDFFEQKIRPVLVTHCYECHSAAADSRGKQKGSLALDTRAAVRQGGESGPTIVLGKPDESLLVKAIRHDADAPAMPPSAKLPAAAIADLTEWVRRGAPDPRDGTAVAKRRGLTIEEGRRFWSLIAPRSSRTPQVARGEWPADELDAWVALAQQQQGLEPLADATPRALIRRLYFDLTGLPPAPEEVEQFVSDGANAAALTNSAGEASASGDVDAAAVDLASYERVVDRLLHSTHFGERWGRHWLDVARYADSNGRDRNVYFYHAWRYRDYVFESFNRDLPYDQFVREQVAGDLLESVTAEARDRQRVATGFLALGPKAFEEQKPEIFRMDGVDEQIELIGRSILGLSLGCARCHDHKFDPLPTVDYYALAGIFRSTQPLYGYGPKGIKANVHTHTDLAAVGPLAESRAEEARAYLAKLQELTLTQNIARSDRYRVVRRVADARLQLDKPDAKREELEADIARMDAEIKEWDAKVKSAEEALQAAMDTAPPQPDWAMGVRDRPMPENSRVHHRGDVLNLGDEVPRGMPQVISLQQTLVPSAGSSGRRELAQWLTDRANPLTARVAVNRVWQQLLGRGLVTTPDDFGVNGSRPSHPELLDHLAVRFMEDGWSIKQLVRRIVMSRTYRLAVRDTEATDLLKSQVEQDPDNVYLWRMRPRRLEAESLRDAVMTLAGTLDRNAPDPRDSWLAKYNPYREDEYRTFKPLFLPAEIDHRHRSVFLPIVRGVLPEMFQLFDFAAPDRVVAQREESTVPAQSLFFLNNPWLVQQARQAAARLGSELPEGEAQASNEAGVQRLFEQAYSRRATASELAAALEYLNRTEGHGVPAVSGGVAKTPVDPRVEAWVSLCQVIMASAEFRFLP